MEPTSSRVLGRDSTSQAPASPPSHARTARYTRGSMASPAARTAGTTRLTGGRTERAAARLVVSDSRVWVTGP